MPDLSFGGSRADFQAMRSAIFAAIVVMFSLSSVSRGAPRSDFHDHLGLQLWSLRSQVKEGVPAALDQVRAYGLTEIETAGTGNLSPASFADELRRHGLKAASAHVGYDLLKKDISAAIRDAQALGVTYIVCPTIPHLGTFNEASAHRVAADFNTWGAACKAAGLRFGYHTHGFEFTRAFKNSDDLVFDILARETKPELVCFEMDVFWVTHAGQDPVRLLEKYPDRWRLLHLKDIRKGAVTGLSTGSAAPIDNVPVGAGQVDWPAVLRKAAEVGVDYYFIEDETPAPLQNIPASLKYLRGLHL
jgi:sugar phosphate isomerase/epimerase